ncbi:hypothetical protein SAMN05421869_10758 [Nonomuraea jiangxiensis]|uniref:Uncharacterized protein n=1 Tax=Nonomuraea jiangxiensis TaxID=633440 RepID=A0A1G8NBK2_9ACTN|nr:hypothetical protein SAMN05421869_10758 [Nonomuraea jiangxiensis]
MAPLTQIAKALGAEVAGVCGTGDVGSSGRSGRPTSVEHAKGEFPRGAHAYDLILDKVAEPLSRGVRARMCSTAGGEPSLLLLAKLDISG